MSEKCSFFLRDFSSDLVDRLLLLAKDSITEIMRNFVGKIKTRDTLPKSPGER